MEKILSYIEDTYAPAALFVYGSYADGSNGPDSDFDALALTADGPARRDVSLVDGVRLDLFVHPAADFQGDFPMAEFLRLLDGKLVWDRDGSGKALLEKLAQQAKDQSAEFVTIFYGEDVSDEQAQAAEEIFSRACPGAELSVLPGGQPVYYYIVSIE